MTTLAKKYFLLTFLISLLFNCAPKQKSFQELESKANLAIDSFQKELLGTLQNTIKEKGIVEAIDKCKITSPNAEEKFSKLEGGEFRRLSSKNRNQAHAPKDWEAKALSKWEEQIANKETIGIYKEETESEFRFLKPIFIANPTCLKCHGVGEIEKDVASKIKNLYPEDKATGYKMSELRGAFSVVWKK